MIRGRQIAWVKKLAQQGVSQRQIVRETGISRQTVRAILAGEPRPELLMADTLYDVDVPVFNAPPARCPTCGAVVWQPCLACSLPKKKFDKCDPTKRREIKDVNRRRRGID